MLLRLVLAILCVSSSAAQTVCSPVQTVPQVYYGTLAQRPAAGLCGRLYVVTDAPAHLSFDTGSSWNEIASDWSYVNSKPTTYTPVAHTHAESDVVNLQTDLAGKAAATHTHAEADVVNLVSDLAAKQAALGFTAENSANKNATNGYPGLSSGVISVGQIPTIAESGVTNLTTDLAAKVPTSRTVSSSAPLTGGGALSGDQTIACATCAVTIATGTATFATTAIASGAQSAAATISGTQTNILATDAVSWAYKTTPSGSTDGRLIPAPVIAAGSISFTRTNPTASSITPTAIVVNWRVER